MLGNSEQFGDFYWGLITGSFVLLGITLHTAGDLYFVREINPVVGLLEKCLLHWGKFSRVLEVDSAGEEFSEIETLAGSHSMRRILGRFITAPSSKCCSNARKCLLGST